ncbi:flagellar hook-length control protein FliK [Paenibacillus sp. MBLB2552]|uniref:Flagellar hook-length control protein FliK n=1 Tax=Paenibacillus mellifer TaxID=2937794 RepID=A0A9X1Y3C3_9BACL|nr:flagellar hook-length control protein FliK [Paenibacillus mellifer]MCK8488603.1 flagellar hook-length control protein FliK [Paenibacillus mellifer]
MNQTVTQVNGNKAGSVQSLWYGATGKTEASPNAALSFDQKLLSMLLGNAQPQEGQTSAQLLTLVGVQKGADAVPTDATDSTLAAMIEGLLQQLPKLDEALQADPSLMAALQGWLQNVQTLLQQTNTPQMAGTVAEETNVLPTLAQQPETMRFAVQDALVQLLAAAGSNADAAKLTASAQEQAGAMLDMLQGVLDSLPETVETKLNGGKGTESVGGLHPRVLMADQGNGANPQGSFGQNGDTLNQGNPQTAQHSTKTGINTAAVHAFSSVHESDTAVDGLTVAPSEQEDSVPTGQIVTAGQLAIRDSGIITTKHVARPVPVEQFAKEMSGFLVSKLDIVNLKGVSEAKISLYPEHLGQVDVRITMQNGQLTAQFMTEHAFAKESLEQQMAQLRTALQSQGLQVNKLEVTQNTSLSSHMYHDGRQSGSGAGQQQSEKRRPLVEDDTLAIHDINEEWNEWVAEVRAKEQNYGSSFVARA